MFKRILCFGGLLLVQFHCIAQNLPSLVTGRNSNSTFSITAYDPIAKEWGIAVATNNIYVGNSTIYIEPGTGAFSVIAETDPDYGINGLQQLKQRKSIREAIDFTRLQDDMSDYRQVAGVDSAGNGYAFTGSSLRYWKGTAACLTGKGYVVMGNQLAPGTLKAMSQTFEESKGTLAERLLKALLAGEKAGGQISGKQSAALTVKGSQNQWFNQIDLRVDHSSDPFGDLARLLNYHYGRILINQAVYALNQSDTARAKAKLGQAINQTTGWYGIYPKIAKAELLLGDEKAACQFIRAAVKAEPKWKANLSAFYCLYDHPEIRSLYPESRFDVIDWNNAISMFIDLGRTNEAIKTAQKTLQRFPESSYTWYLLAKAEQEKGDGTAALQANANALKYDPVNADAKRLAPTLGPALAPYHAINREITVTDKGIRLSAADGDGVAWLKNVTFTNGTIDVDLKGKNANQQSFLGIAFHATDARTLDAVYFRPFNFRSRDSVRRGHSVQYVSHPQYPWPVLRQQFTGQYEQPVTPSPDPDDWFHVRIVLRYPEISVFVNHNLRPSLVVKQLNGRKTGKLGFWVGNNSDGEFAHLKLTPDN